MSVEDIKKLRDCQAVVRTAVHPDTGEYIPWVMRISSFIPINIPIAFGFIVAKPTPFNTIFWQWINQTYNAALNYGNRNASSTYTNEDIMKSYAVATVSSIVVALGIRKAISGITKNLKGSKLLFANSFSSFLACSSAGCLNALFMRKSELNTGIDISDSEGKVYGKSQKCAKTALTQIGISRYMLTISIMLPSIMRFLLEKARLAPKNFVPRTTLEILLIAM